MSKLIKLSILSFIFTANIYAYVDMTDTRNRAKELNLIESDYAFAMAIAGTFTGSMFGLFLWKTK